VPERGQRETWQWAGFWDGAVLDLNRTRSELPANDNDAAALMMAERPGEIHYVEMSERHGTWYIWDTRCHRPDDSGMIKRLVSDYAVRVLVLLREARRMTEQAVTARMPGASDRDIANAVRQDWAAWGEAEKYHHGLQRSAGQNSLIKYLTGPAGTSPQELEDRWPEYLNCASGVVCLRTGLISPHDPRWMMTYCVGTAYRPGARGSGWDALVWHVAGENADVCRYLIRMLGYSLIGDNREQLIFFMQGPTASGKSQVLEACSIVAGTLAHASTSALISTTRSERHARVENSIAGKRLITIDESAERVRVDEGQVKRLTGAARISRNQLYAAVETPVRVSGTIWQATNEMPTISGFDGAIKRRVRAVPCGSTIDEGAQEKKIAERLARDEGEAILASLVWGAMDYFANGESRPAEVELATAQYEAEQNTAAAFREECTMAVPDWNGDGHASWPTMAEIRKEYVAWCEATRTSCMPKHAFNTAFRALPGIEYQESSRRFLHLTVIQSYIRGKVGQDD